MTERQRKAHPKSSEESTYWDFLKTPAEDGANGPTIRKPPLRGTEEEERILRRASNSTGIFRKQWAISPTVMGSDWSTIMRREVTFHENHRMRKAECTIGYEVLLRSMEDKIGRAHV